MRARALCSCVSCLLVLAVACSYNPHPEDGVQKCYEDACVDGYVCGNDNRCYLAGHVPGGGQGGAAGLGSSTMIGPGGAVIGGERGTGGMVGTGGWIGNGGRGSGVTGLGGALGTGGATTCQPARASGTVSLIDDMSDGDGAIITQDGRVGGWFAYNDETGVQTPTPPAVASKTGWICTSGSGFGTWGAGVAVSLDSDDTRSCAYDVSAYQGLRFAVQGTVAGGRIRFSLNTSDVAAAATSVGGTCVSSSTARNDCDDTYGVWMTNTSFSGTTQVSCHNGVASPWVCSTTSAGATSTTVSVPFSSMKQEGWGRAIPFNLEHVLYLGWQAKNYYLDPSTGITADLGPTSFDICIGHLSFY